MIISVEKLLQFIFRYNFMQAVGGRPPQYDPALVTLTLDLLTLKAVSQ